MFDCRLLKSEIRYATWGFHNLQLCLLEQFVYDCLINCRGAFRAGIFRTGQFGDVA